MIRMMAMNKDHERIDLTEMSQLFLESHLWAWVDFSEPTESESELLKTVFNFHSLAIEDCLHDIQRPKMDHYDECHFFVLQHLDPKSYLPSEVDLFLKSNLIVSYHKEAIPEMDQVWDTIHHEKASKESPHYVAYKLMDKLVDGYFPPLHTVEANIQQLGEEDNQIEKLFQSRAQLLKIRQTVLPMRDLLYRILNSTSLSIAKDRYAHFTDVYDHLIKLSERIENSREMTSDLRDSYLSLASHRMNNIMLFLTTITLIFLPLTFIVGVEGMNFVHMPELHLKYGYLYVWLLMGGITVGLVLWMKKKGWFKL